VKTLKSSGKTIGTAEKSRNQLYYELISGGSGLLLTLFMWGHLLLVGSILLGTRSFDWVADTLENYYIAQPTVAVIIFAFLVHAVMASRKIPTQLCERKRMQQLAKGLCDAGRGHSIASHGYSAFRPHLESMLWIWQVRTGMIMLVLGSFHLILIGLDIFTPLFGVTTGIEAISSLKRVQLGLWPLYGLLLLCVEFHASVGLYRLSVKWGIGSRITRTTLRRVEQVMFWLLLGLGILTLVVLAGWLSPPLAFLIAD
jgi:fumarate reductase subunit C